MNEFSEAVDVNTAASPRPANDRSVLLRLALLALILALAVVRVLRHNEPTFADDAYITMHSARVVQDGYDRAYPGVPALIGATSGVHVLLIAALGSAMPLHTADEITLWASAVLYGLGLIELARTRLSWMPAAGLVLAGFTTAATLQQLSNGQETGLAMAGVCWTIVLAQRSGWQRRVALPLVAGTLPFVRPELLLVPIGLIAAELRTDPRGARSTAALVIAAAAPWFLWYVATTGLPYPSTMTAKRAFFAESYWPISGKLRTAVQGLAQFGAGLGAIGVGVAALARSHLGKVALAIAGVFVLAYTLALPSALGHYDGRYLHPLIPIFVFGVVLLTARRPAFGALVIALALGQNIWLLPARLEERTIWTSVTTDELAPLAAWLRTHVDLREPLLIHDAGYLSETTPFRLVDMVGLKTPDSVAVHRRYTEPTLGAGRATSVGIIAERARTRYMVLTPRFVPDLVPGMRKLGWRLTLVHEVRRHPQVFYQVYAIGPPGGAEPGSQP